jgi:nondiscriminating glutamyl-tRNA synthetase
VSSSSVRVRFAPSPTGIMHIGNSRTALLNLLFAKQKNGTFVLRIEDTDPARNFDPGAKTILKDLAWLDVHFDEGPEKGGPYAPYFQSERRKLYQEKLDELKAMGAVYPCFCTEKELEKKRERQRALKLPPRYDRTCLNLSKEEADKKIADGVPHIWRMKLDHHKTITITDLARGPVTFELKNFSDFPLTRTDGSFTFMFANFVDDLLMNITHVFRGEDHQSNTAGQAALYAVFGAPLPIFWHMPMLCNIDGKKLSKRDFGFSLHDLRDAGYLPEAINNYLAIIGGSFKDEIMDLKQLTHTLDFDHMHSTSTIKYDVEKLRWVNHQWIQKLDPADLAQRIKPLLIAAYPTASQLDNKKLAEILQLIKTDLYTLNDAVEALSFYFKAPELSAGAVEACVEKEHRTALKKIMQEQLAQISDIDAFIDALKKAAKTAGIPLKQLFWFIRLALTGKVNGPGIHELLLMLGADETAKRIEHTLKVL